MREEKEGGTHGNTHVGLGQGDCVVDTVADHEHALALLLQLAHHRRLLERLDLGDDSLGLDPELPRHKGTCLGVVSRYHVDLQALSLQPGNDGGRVELGLVGDGEGANADTRDCDEDDGTALAAMRVSSLAHLRGQLDLLALEQSSVAHEDALLLHEAADALASQDLVRARF